MDFRHIVVGLTFCTIGALRPVHAQNDKLPPALPLTSAELEFNSWAQKNAEKARQLAPDGWEVAYEGWPARPFHHGLPVKPGLALGMRSKREMQLEGWPAKKRTVVLAVVLRDSNRRFVPPPPAPPLTRVPIGISRSIDNSIAYFVGSSADATYYSERQPSEIWFPFLAELNKSFGIQIQYTSVDDLLHELAYGRPGEPLYQHIASRSEAEQLTLARFLVEQIRATDPFLVVSDEVLSRVVNHNVATPALEMRPFLMVRDSAIWREKAKLETAEKWDAWIHWAEGKTEEQWMQRALAENIALARRQHMLLDTERLEAFFDRNLGPDAGIPPAIKYSPKAPVPEKISFDDFSASSIEQKSNPRIDAAIAFYHANKDRLAWNRQIQRFELRR